MGNERYVIEGINYVLVESKTGTPIGLYREGSPQYDAITSMHKTHRSVGP